jgi:Pyridine nucleotide-disulphide oxidoreductase, dimerisation domain
MPKYLSEADNLGECKLPGDQKTLQEIPKHRKLSPSDVIYAPEMAIAYAISYWIIPYALAPFVDTESDRILGFTAFGVGAGEIIATVQVAMLAGLPYTVLRDSIFAHPTMLEGLIPLFSAVSAKSNLRTEGHAPQLSPPCSTYQDMSSRH